jgi:hypothetical protein
MAFNHENLNVYRRLLPFNVKVGIWTGEWDSAEKEELSQILRMLVGLRKSWAGSAHVVREDCAKGLRHGLVDDRGGDPTMMQSTKPFGHELRAEWLATKPFGHELRAEWLATKKLFPPQSRKRQPNPLTGSSGVQNGVMARRTANRESPQEPGSTRRLDAAIRRGRRTRKRGPPGPRTESDVASARRRSTALRSRQRSANGSPVARSSRAAH